MARRETLPLAGLDLDEAVRGLNAVRRWKDMSHGSGVFGIKIAFEPRTWRLGKLEDYGLGCVRACVVAMLSTLKQIHGADPIVPIEFFCAKHPKNESVCAEHAHNCRQATLQLGAPRHFIVEGAGLPSAINHRREFRIEQGDLVILDGQVHGVRRGTGMRYSLNLFYATERDFASDRQGRSPPTVRTPRPSGVGTSHCGRCQACYLCGMHRPSGDRCVRALPDTWNQGGGIVE